MCCSDPPEAPDYSAAAQMSEETARRAQDLAEKQYSWAVEESKKNREILDRYLAISEPVMEEQAEAGREARERYKEIYQPIEDYAAQEAMEYASEARQQREAAQAMSEVGQAYAAQRENAQQRLESYGVDPSMTRSQALDVDLDIAEANMKAGAGRAARDRIEDIGRSLRGEAINVGRGYPSETAQAYGQAVQSGQMGTSTALNTSQVAGGLMGTAPQYMGIGLQGNQVNIDTLDTSYANQLAEWRADQQSSPWRGIGALGGMAAKGYFGGTWTPFADGGTLPPALQLFDGGVVVDSHPTTAGVRTASYANGGAIHGGATTSANLRPMSFADGRAPLGVLTGGGGPGMGGVTGPQRTTAGLRPLSYADGTQAGGTGQTHASGGDSSYQGSRANVRYPMGNSGGLIVGASDGTGIDDAIPAQVSAGEYVIPADVVHIKGREFFDKLLEKYHAPAAEQQAQDTPPPNLGVPALPVADGGLPRQVPAHYGAQMSALPPASGGAGYMDGGALYLTGGRGGNPDKRVHRTA